MAICRNPDCQRTFTPRAGRLRFCTNACKRLTRLALDRLLIEAEAGLALVSAIASEAKSDAAAHTPRRRSL